jgi:hypothetical protein
MTFLQPILLFGLPLILVPVVIHLLNRLRHRTQQWAAMRFLVAASRSSVSKAKLKQFLILLFRTLAVLMLILFLARPLSGGWMGWAFASAPDTVLILLDRSSSMETRLAATSLSRREQALELLEQAATAYIGHSHFVLIDSASSSAQTVTNMEELKEHAMAEPTDTSANIPSLLQRSLQWLIDNQAGTTEIWIASDLQRSNWQPSDDRWGSLMKQFENLPQSLRFRLLAVNEQTEQDVGLQLADLKITTSEKGRTLRLVTDVTQSQLAEETLIATRTINGLSAGVEIPMEAAQVRWQDQWDLGAVQDAGWGSLTLPADGNARNNALHFVYGKALSHQALAFAGHTYIGNVLSLAAGRIEGGNLLPAELSSLPGGNTLQTSDISLITWQGELPKGEQATQLIQFATEGGVVVCFPDYFPNNSETTFAGVRWMDLETAPNFGTFVVGRWEKDTGPLADTNEGFSIPLDQLEVLKRRRLQHNDSVVAAFSDGEPLLVHQKVGQGSIYFVTTLPIGDWSGLDQGPVLLPMLQRMSQDGTRRLESTLYWTCGEISEIDLEAGWEPVEEGSEHQMAWHAGVYRLGDRLAAVNTPASEYDLAITTQEEVEPLFEGQNFQMFQDKAGQGDTKLQGEIWRVFLFLMLLFLLVESWLMMTGPGTVAQTAFLKKVQPSTTGGAS